MESSKINDNSIPFEDNEIGCHFLFVAVQLRTHSISVLFRNVFNYN